MRSKRKDPNDLIGLKKLNQEIIEFVKYNIKSKRVYKVKCNFCEHEYNSTIENFRDVRKSGQCCIKCSNTQNKEYERLTATDAQININFSNYKSKCKFKNWEFNLDKSEFKNFVLDNCYYCNQKPNQFRQDRCKGERIIDSSFLMNGIDRLDSNIGYNIDNCVSCCEDCNKAKRNLSYEQFLDLIKRIYEFKIKEL